MKEFYFNHMQVRDDMSKQRKRIVLFTLTKRLDCGGDAYLNKLWVSLDHSGVAKGMQEVAIALGNMFGGGQQPELDNSGQNCENHGIFKYCNTIMLYTIRCGI